MAEQLSNSEREELTALHLKWVREDNLTGTEFARMTELKAKVEAANYVPPEPG